jgi:hypothetical protein
MNRPFSYQTIYLLPHCFIFWWVGCSEAQFSNNKFLCSENYRGFFWFDFLNHLYILFVLHCNTNSMNTTFSIRLEQDLKKSFLAKTKAKWLEWAVLIRYFMESFNSNPDIVKFEIEEQLFDDILNNKETRSKLEKISNKLDTLWF